MRVLSIDVGIKNLAICLVDHQEAECRVQWWNVIDIVDEQIFPCEARLKAGEPCSQRAAFVGKKNEETLAYYCGSHKSHHIKEMPAFEVEEHLNEWCGQGKCKSKCQVKVNGTPMCKKHMELARKAHHKNFGLHKVRKAKCKDLDCLTLRLKIWQSLGAFPQFLTVDEVVIENQPSLKNPVMKSVAETIYNYFVCRGMIDEATTGSTVKDIKYVSPSNKLKVCKDEMAIVGKIKNASMRYKKTKQMSVDYVAALVREEPIGNKHFMEANKKDDLADCLLQALAYLTGKNLHTSQLTFSELS